MTPCKLGISQLTHTIFILLLLMDDYHHHHHDYYRINQPSELWLQKMFKYIGLHSSPPFTQFCRFFLKNIIKSCIVPRYASMMISSDHPVFLLKWTCSMGVPLTSWRLFFSFLFFTTAISFVTSVMPPHRALLKDIVDRLILNKKWG